MPTFGFKEAPVEEKRELKFVPGKSKNNGVGDTPAKNRRGRPRTRHVDPTLPIRYPIQWKPIYDQIIYEHIGGETHRAIAARYNFTPQQVGNIVNCPQAQDRIATIRGRLNDSQFSQIANLDDKIKRIKEKVVDRLEEFVDNNTYMASSPFSFLSTASRTLQSLSGESAKRSGDTNTQVNINNSKNIIISAESAQNVREALEISKSLGLAKTG